jgi:hypothetical protein
MKQMKIMTTTKGATNVLQHSFTKYIAGIMMLVSCSKPPITQPDIPTPAPLPPVVITPTPPPIETDRTTPYIQWVECTWYNSIPGLKSVVAISNITDVAAIYIQTLFPTKAYILQKQLGFQTLTLTSGYMRSNENWHQIKIVLISGEIILGTALKPVLK